MTLWHSQITLLQGPSAAVVFTSVLKFSHKSIKSVETNFPAFSLNVFLNEPNRLIQCFKDIFMTKFGSLLLIIVPLLDLENSSIKCRHHNLFPSWCRSIASVIKIHSFSES